ncbi:MAG: carbonate dehydratase [Chloroflexota bacterium]|nr:carbonate dehydratase [Chloroflexota bacterium]
MGPIGCGCDEFRWRRLVTRRHLLKGGVGLAALGLHLPAPRFAARAQEATPGTATEGRAVIQGQETSPIVNGSYISPLVEIYGDVEVGERCFVASNTILFATDGQLVSLGNENNCQDNAYLLAQEAGLRFGDMVSIAHQAIIENSAIGDFTFFGFRSRTRNCEVGEGSMIMHNTTVENVTIPPNRITPLGVRITTQAEADALPELVEANEEFKRGVQDVNLAFVEGYTALYERLGRSGLEAVGPNPVTEFNPESVVPQIGAGSVLGELVRIVGDVRLGEGSAVGQRTALRADEGTPIVIGRRARIQSRVTFHALEGTLVDVGDDAQIGDGNVVHGPVRIGDNFQSEDDCVVFRATIEDNVTVRTGATVAGDFVLREGTIVPEGSVVTTQAEADALPIR